MGADTKLSGPELAREVMRHFHPMGLEGPSAAYFAGLDETLSRLPSAISPIGTAFKHNLHAALSTVSVPVMVASASIEQARFQRLYLSEQLLARAHDEEPPPEELHKRAQRRFEEELKTKEGADALVASVSRFLLGILKSSPMTAAAKELLRQGVILAWSAFEVVSRDIFIAFLNARPESATELIRAAGTRKLFPLKQLDFELLASYGFDLSATMGHVLASLNTLGDLPTIKEVFGVLFPGATSLRETLSKRELWVLSQQRHLIVHRRGIIDQKYLDSTGESLRVGETLEVSQEHMEESITLIRDTGKELLQAGANAL